MELIWDGCGSNRRTEIKVTARRIRNEKKAANGMDQNKIQAIRKLQHKKEKETWNHWNQNQLILFSNSLFFHRIRRHHKN